MLYWVVSPMNLFHEVIARDCCYDVYLYCRYIYIVLMRSLCEVLGVWAWYKRRFSLMLYLVVTLFSTLFNDTWLQEKHLVSCFILFAIIAITRSDIKLRIMGPVNLVTADDHICLCGYLWLNILTLSLWRFYIGLSIKGITFWMSLTETAVLLCI